MSISALLYGFVLLGGLSARVTVRRAAGRERGLAAMGRSSGAKTLSSRVGPMAAVTFVVASGAPFLAAQVPNPTVAAFLLYFAGFVGYTFIHYGLWFYATFRAAHDDRS